MADTNTNTQQAQEPAAGAAAQQEATFTQADVDNIVNKRLERERKKYPGEEELTAFRAWKDSQQTEKEKWDSLTRERDESSAALAAAQAELTQFKREKYLLDKGVSADEAEFYAFKIGNNNLTRRVLQSLKSARTYPAGSIAGDYILIGRGTSQTYKYVNSSYRVDTVTNYNTVDVWMT